MFFIKKNECSTYSSRILTREECDLSSLGLSIKHLSGLILRDYFYAVAIETLKFFAYFYNIFLIARLIEIVKKLFRGETQNSQGSNQVPTLRYFSPIKIS